MTQLAPPGCRRIEAKLLLLCALAATGAACQRAPTPGTQPSASSAPPVASAPNAAPAPGDTAPPPAPAATAQGIPPGPAAGITPPPGNAAAPAPAPEASTRPAPEAAAAPEVKSIEIPAGTHLTVKLESPLSSATSTVGEKFSATLVNGVTVHGAHALPRHVTVVGKVVDAKAAGKFAGDASLGLRLESVANHAVVTSAYTRRANGKGARTAAVIGGTSVAGALLGALAGHGRGAAIGAVAGGGVGALGAAETGNNRDIVLPQGAVLTFTLRDPITVER